jgi:cytochrome c556
MGEWLTAHPKEAWTMRVPFRAGVVVAIALAAVAYASAQSGTPASNAIAARQQLMKDQGAAMRSISQKGKAGQIMEIATDAEILARTANQIPGLFPPGSVDPEKSRAKPEIWQKWSEFEEHAKALNTKATQLAATAKTGDAATTTAAAADLGRTTCGPCHDAFRGPEIKK